MVNELIKFFSKNNEGANYTNKINAAMIIITGMMLARISTYPALTVAFLGPNMVVIDKHIIKQLKIGPLLVIKKNKEGKEIVVSRHWLNIYLVPILALIGALLVIPNQLLKKFLKVDSAKLEKYFRLLVDTQFKKFDDQQDTKSEARECQKKLLISIFEKLIKIGQEQKKEKMQEQLDKYGEDKGCFQCNSCPIEFKHESPIWSREVFAEQLLKQVLARTISTLIISIIMLLVVFIQIASPTSKQVMEETVPLDCTFKPEIKYLNPVKSIQVKFLPSVLLSYYAPAMYYLLITSIFVAGFEAVMITILFFKQKGGDKLVPEIFIVYFMTRDRKLSQRLSAVNKKYDEIKPESVILRTNPGRRSSEQGSLNDNMPMNTVPYSTTVI